MLQRRLGEAGLGLKPAQDTKKLRYTDIRDAYIAEARNKGLRFDVRKDGAEYLMGVPQLDAFFTGMRVTDITTDRIRDYIEAGKKAGVTGSTIRRSLAVLRTMFNQSRKEGKLRLADVPYFPMPKEGKARQGFVEPGVFESVTRRVAGKPTAADYVHIFHRMPQRGCEAYHMADGCEGLLRNHAARRDYKIRRAIAATSNRPTGAGRVRSAEDVSHRWAGV